MTVYAAPDYDAFISYGLEDKPWVETVLLPALTEARIRVCSPDDFDPGLPVLTNTERAIARSRKIVLVLTPNWLRSDWAEFQQLLMQSRDPAGLNARVVPLLAEPCEPPARISMLTPVDFTDEAVRDREMARLLRALKPRIFISYKRQQRPDSWLATHIYKQLRLAEYEVFIDQELRVGQDWAKTIEQQIEASDFVIVLLSEASVQSEMVVKEVEHAYWRHQRASKAHLLPVRVNYDAARKCSLLG